MREMRVKFYEAKQELDDAKQKMSFFTKDAAVDFTELEEALALVKQKRLEEDETMQFFTQVKEMSAKGTCFFRAFLPVVPFCTVFRSSELSLTFRYNNLD